MEREEFQENAFNVCMPYILNPKYMNSNKWCPVIQSQTRLKPTVFLRWSRSGAGDVEINCGLNEDYDIYIYHILDQVMV